jgi:hypothetical protein
MISTPTITRSIAHAMVKLVGRLTASDLQQFSAHDWISLRHEIQRQ